ncbi:MAG TPA: VTT domain-containing protein [Gemmatimonadales bacterium]|jgi:membrane protein DedA with SNARE-associated domain|nr:VTT domain-containing protein [Gemmatimonadales bacterium]
MTLETFLERHGLPALFLVAIVEGDLSLVLAGVLAHLRLLPFAAAVVAGALGNLTGDLVWYTLGRLQHDRIRTTRLYRRAGPEIERLSRWLGPWQLLAARIVYGTRNASMLFWGVLRLPVTRFLAIDALGCLLASAGFAGLGYLVGHGTTSLVGSVQRIERWLLLGVAAGAGVLWGVRRAVSRSAVTSKGER